MVFNLPEGRMTPSRSELGSGERLPALDNSLEWLCPARGDDDVQMIIHHDSGVEVEVGRVEVPQSVEDQRWFLG